MRIALEDAILIAEDIAAALHIDFESLELAITHSGMSLGTLAKDKAEYERLSGDELVAYHALYQKYVPLLRSGLIAVGNRDYSPVINRLNSIYSGLNTDPGLKCKAMQLFLELNRVNIAAGQ